MTPSTTSPSGRLAGQVAWISGAASGIGEATALRFAREGASVGLADRSEGKLDALAKQIADGGGEAAAFACDVSNEGQVRESIDATAERFGKLDCVVNNAAVVLVKKLHETTSEEWETLMAVNVRSIFFSLRAALPHLRGRGGSIVNVGSISSFVGQADTPVYVTTKHAVLGLSRSIALDYAADGIRCNCVCPGITATPMLLEHLERLGNADVRLANRMRRVPQNRAMQPDDIAKAIVFLSCGDSAGVTGTSLVVDGGYLATAEWDAAPDMP